MKYQMKDLGYKRTPTDAAYRVTIDRGWVYDVPVQVIADSRDENYSDDQEDTIGFILAGELDEGNITDWASNNMNWDDVEKYAVRIEVPEDEPDYQEGWVNGTHSVIGLQARTTP